MASRQGMIRTTIALGIAFALAAPLTASAQGGGGGAQPAIPGQGAGGGAGAQAGGGGQGGRGRGGPPPYTPAAGARDLRSGSMVAAHRIDRNCQSRQIDESGRGVSLFFGYFDD